MILTINTTSNRCAYIAEFPSLSGFMKLLDEPGDYIIITDLMNRKVMIVKSHIVSLSVMQQ